MRMHLGYLNQGDKGYGRFGIEVHRALEAAGVEVIPGLLPDEKNPANVAAWGAVPAHSRGWLKGMWSVMWTMWETNKIPDTFAEALPNFDQLLVPCDMNLEVFSALHPNVAKVPLGVDTEAWAYVPRSDPVGRFNFLTAAAGNARRKGVDATVAAFKDAFTGREDPKPHLIVKSKMALDMELPPDVQEINGNLSELAQKQLFASAHCYVGAARAEGWGLMPLQAICQGCPTILTDAHGQAEYAHLGLPISAKLAPADYFPLYGPAGEWWDPDHDELVDTMRWVYHEYRIAEKYASLTAPRAADQFSWEAAAEKFIDAVGKDRLDTPYQGDGSWRELELVRYPVRVNQARHVSIGGTSFFFRPGETTYECADIKRILYESGILDPSCADEGGLSPAQATSLRSASQGPCPTCGQVLGSGEMWEPDDDPE